MAKWLRGEEEEAKPSRALSPRELVLGSAFSVSAGGEASGYEEWDASAAVRIGPGESGRGLSLTLTPVWGDAGSGTQRLWDVSDARGLAPESPAPLNQ